jgi:hypothetical protein
MHAHSVVEDWKKKMGPEATLILQAVNRLMGTNYR